MQSLTTGFLEQPGPRSKCEDSFVWCMDFSLGGFAPVHDSLFWTHHLRSLGRIEAGGQALHVELWQRYRSELLTISTGVRQTCCCLCVTVKGGSDPAGVAHAVVVLACGRETSRIR